VLSRAWLALSIPGALAAVALLVRAVRSLVRAVRGSVMATIPLPPSSTPVRVDFSEAGTFAISVETTRGRSWTAITRGLRLKMVDDTGYPLAVQPSLVKTKVSSFDLVRVPPETALVVSHPIGARIVAHVLVLVVLGGALIAALVVSGIAISGAELERQAAPQVSVATAPAGSV
jgi:hypothetical protein